MKSKFGKWALVALVIALIVAYFALDLGRFLTLEALKESGGEFKVFYSTHPFATVLAFTGIYVLVTALSLPGAAILTLAGGALFGLVTGTVVVSFASTIGATLAFLAARHLFRDAIQSRFRDRLEPINAGIEKEGAFYLFTLRLIPAFPFFVVNLVMGLTPIRTATYFGVSQLGMLPGTIVFVNAGTQLAEVDSLGGILSPALIGSFALLGVFPLVAKKLIEAVRRRSAR